MSSAVFEKSDEEFGKACKILFGSENGSLADFAPYLEEYVQNPAIFVRTSWTRTFMFQASIIPLRQSII